MDKPSFEQNEELDRLIEAAAAGDETACSQLFGQYRDRLTRMVRLRMDRKLKARIDASDVVQEVTLEAARRLPEYANEKPVAFFSWLRWIANDKLIDSHRFHVDAQKRQVDREVSIFSKPIVEATSCALAEHLLGRLASPLEAVQLAETQIAIENALNGLEPVDREVLVLRHFEHLSNKETAEILGLKKSGASRRYVAALKRLKEHLAGNPIFAQYFQPDGN